MYIALHVTHVILARLSSNLNLPNRYSKSAQISNFMKFRPVGDDFFELTDEWTDMMKIIYNLTNAPHQIIGYWIMLQDVNIYIYALF